MAITYVSVSLFDSDLSTLVNPVNCFATMGAGLAKAFAKRYPEIVDKYQKDCYGRKLTPGKLTTCDTNDGKRVIFFPTKDYWKDPSKILYIEEGLSDFKRRYDQLVVNGVSFPKIGCGLGGLEWKDVQPIMETYLKDLPIDIHIHV